MVEAALDFFFNTMKWVFNTFLIDIKILGISVLYYFFAILLLGFIISALINRVTAGNIIVRSMHSDETPPESTTSYVVTTSKRNGKVSTTQSTSTRYRDKPDWW